MPDSTLLPALRQWAENISPGGFWVYGGLAGLWHLDLVYGRSMISDSIIGFRPQELADLVRDAEEAPKLRAEIEGLKAGRDRLRVEVGEMVKDAEEAAGLRARLADLEGKLAAADRLAYRLIDRWTHPEDCEGHTGDCDDLPCAECRARDGDLDPTAPDCWPVPNADQKCTCTCGMCAIWRDALIIRPQGVRDPQPGARGGQ